MGGEWEAVPGPAQGAPGSRAELPLPLGGGAGMLPLRGHQPLRLCSSAPCGRWACHVRVALWVLAGGWGGAAPPPLLCLVCLFYFRPRLSAPPPPETLLPAWNHPPLKDWPLAHLSDTVYGSVVTVPLQNKDCSGQPGPLPPAAWGVGRAAGGGPAPSRLTRALRTWAHSGNPHPVSCTTGVSGAHTFQECSVGPG